MFGEGQHDEVVTADVPRSAAHALSWAYTAPQPGMFWKRELLSEGFDERWRYCFDHELYVRLLLAGHKCDHLPVTLAAYRLHPTSKTVAEGDLFDREFDQIADIYEPKLNGSGRRWCAATRLLRQSFAASRRRKTLRPLRKTYCTRYAFIRRVLRTNLLGMCSSIVASRLRTVNDLDEK